VKLGGVDPVEERDAVMVLVRVLDADEPAVAERDSAGVPVLVAEGERVAVTVGETVAPARERVRVAVTVGETERPALRERVRVAVTVGETETPAWRERVAVTVGVNEAPARERVAVTVAETGPAIREREIVGETVPAGRRRERVPVAEIEPAPAEIRERVAVKLPPTEDGNGVCAHPAETANAKKNSFLIMFMIITLTPRNLFYILSYLREDCFHELPHVVH
jgi:hypothetical protein